MQSPGCKHLRRRKRDEGYVQRRLNEKRDFSFRCVCASPRPSEAQATPDSGSTSQIQVPRFQAPVVS